MQLQLTAEWVIVIIVALVVLLCTPLLCTKPRRSGVVVPEAEPERGPAPKAPRTQGPPPPPADPPPPPPDLPDLPDLPPLLRWIPPRPEAMDTPPGPLDAVPKAPNPAHPAPDVSRRSTACTTSDVFSFGSSARRSSTSSSQRNWHQGFEGFGGQPDMTPRPNFRGSVRFHAGRRSNPLQGRSCFALGPTLQPQLPLHTRSAKQELQTPTSTAWKQRIPVMCQTLHSELVPQPLVDRKGPCDLESLPASYMPRCQSVCPIVERPTITVQPQELHSLSQRPASDMPAPALWQPQVRLILPQQKPVGTERAMRAIQTVECLPEPPEMFQRWCRKSAPHLPPADPRPACPVFGARPRPLRATDLLPLSMPKLKPKQPSAGDAADLDPVTNIPLNIVISVQPGPMIRRSHTKEPSWCTSVQLRKPETPEWPISGNPHGPKRPETEPGLMTPATPNCKEPEEPEEPEESNEDLGATERQKTPVPKATPKATPKAKPKAKAHRGARGATGVATRDATKETESSKTRSASSGKTQDKSGELDSTLGGPSHSWKKGGIRRTEKEGMPGPGHYSPKHAGVHGRSH